MRLQLLHVTNPNYVLKLTVIEARTLRNVFNGLWE